MKSKISNAQKEVWDWKERAFLKLEKIPEEKRIDFIVKKTYSTIEKIKKRKQSLV